jgi:hypothetical protein
LKSSRVGSKAFIAQRLVNKLGRYMAVAEYGGGGWRGFVVISEARGGQGWPGFVLKLWKVLETFQISFGDGYTTCHSEVPLGGFSSSRLKLCSTVPLALAGEAVKRSYAREWLV